MNRLYYKYRYLLLLVSCMISIQLSAQLSIKVDAPRQVSLDSYFQVQYTINTSKSSQFQVPPMSDFKILEIENSKIQKSKN